MCCEKSLRVKLSGDESTGQEELRDFSRPNKAFDIET